MHEHLGRFTTNQGVVFIEQLTTSPPQPDSPHEHHQHPTRRNLTQNRGSAAPRLLGVTQAQRR